MLNRFRFSTTHYVHKSPYSKTASRVSRQPAQDFLAVLAISMFPRVLRVSGGRTERGIIRSYRDEALINVSDDSSDDAVPANNLARDEETNRMAQGAEGGGLRALCSLSTYIVE